MRGERFLRLFLGRFLDVEGPAVEEQGHLEELRHLHLGLLRAVHADALVTAHRAFQDAQQDKVIGWDGWTLDHAGESCSPNTMAQLTGA